MRSAIAADDAVVAQTSQTAQCAAAPRRSAEPVQRGEHRFPVAPHRTRGYSTTGIAGFGNAAAGPSPSLQRLAAWGLALRHSRVNFVGRNGSQPDILGLRPLTTPKNIACSLSVIGPRCCRSAGCRVHGSASPRPQCR
jgi:hypothetical protein